MEGAVVRYILSWVEENIYTGASIGKLVDETGYSRRTLELWFLKYSGFPLGEYLLRRRMSRAAMLLRMTELSILEVSTMFHFYSSQNFTRSFRIFSGVTPTKYRKQDKWSVKLLQRPLLMEDTHNLKAEHCVLPELKLRGSSVVCAHNFILPLVEDDLARRMKSAVSSIRDNSGNEVCIAFRIMPSASLSASRDAVINVEMIIHDMDEKKEGTEEIVIPAGEYIQFRFSGLWSEYIVFTRLVYFKLVEEKVCRRNSYDLIFFTYQPDSNDDLICRLLIPVE